LIVIVGETATGKSALAMRLAKQFAGEIICADSRTVYTGMDIGTAKPTRAERTLVPHHLLDVVLPNEQFDVFDFKTRAQWAISDIAARGKLPLLVGGSGLYIDAVLYNFAFRAPADTDTRARLQKLTIEQLQSELHKSGIELPPNDRNPRHLTRALETGGQISTNKELRPNTLIIGLKADREALRATITKRVDRMVAAGMAEETHALIARYGSEAPALRAPGYKEFAAYIAGSCSLQEAKQATVLATVHLAKRQRTWFKRNKSIHWVSKQDEVVDLITTFLNK